MKNKFLIFIASISTIINSSTYSAEYDYPSETIILHLPNQDENTWKEITHYVTKTERIIESIPLFQTIETWSELICIQYADISTKDIKVRNNIKIILNLIKNEILLSYPNTKVTWRIIENNKKDAIYEWILHAPHNNIPPQHEISRAFLTKTGFHRVAFTRKNNEMNAEERDKWIQLLKEKSSLVSFPKAIHSNGLSMANNLKD